MQKILLILILIILIIFVTFIITQKKEEFTNNIELSPKLTQKDIEDLNKGHHIMTDMFKQFDNICRKHGFKYWCLGGTLIGAIRHEGWIPWDGDIDVGMLKDDYIQFKNIIQSELPDTMWFQSQETDKYYKSNISKIRYLNSNYKDYKSTEWHNGLQLDIFVFDNNSKEIYGQHPVAGMPDKNRRPISDILPLKELKFEHINVYVPNKYKMISKEIWDGFPPILLPIEKRFPHEGRFEFTAPEWMIKKYPELYK